MKTWLRRLTFILATGYILFFYSELMFWARARPEDSLANWLVTWQVYSLSGYAMLSAIVGFRAKRRWALFLCGALFGWLTEGVVVQTMYEAFPLQISWTGLAWHALISVWVGWYGMRRALQQNQRRYILGLSIGLGCFWGMWGMWWWVESLERIAGPGEFAVFALISSSLLFAAYWLWERTAEDGFSLWRAGVIAIGLAYGGLFVFGAAPAAPLAVFVLPPLLLALFLTLERNRRVEEPGSVLEDLQGKVGASSYLLLWAIPFSAIAIYTAAWYLGARIPTGWLVYAVTTPLGFILLAASIYQIWRGGIRPETLD
ncbi:MAG: hypothetical protein AB1894_25985 [Chloroflexota bacterium]